MSENNERKPKFQLMSLLWIGVALISMSAIGVAGYWSRSVTKVTPTEITVARRSFTLEVHERGVVRPARVVAIKSRLPSNLAKLVWIHGEGQRVGRGDVVAQFDTQPFQDAIELAGQSLTDAQTRMVGAEKALLLQQEENAAKVEAARRKLEIARISFQDQSNGTGQLERKRLQLAIDQAQRTVAIARVELKDFEELLIVGHVSQRERDVVADQLRKAEETLQLAQLELTTFERYEQPKLLREAELKVDGAQSNLARVRRTAELEIQKLEEEIAKQKQDVALAQTQLTRARVNLANCDVRAPIDGVLLHSAVKRAEQHQKLQVGDAVWFGQTFMEIPDTRDLEVDLRVREIDVAKLQPEMMAHIELDAFPGQQFTGRLIAIDTLSTNDVAGQSVRRFSARVRFAEAAPGVRVGMSADVKIIYRELNDVVALDTAAVEYHDGQAVVWVGEEKGAHPVPVGLGSVGPQWVEVLSGVTEGDRVRINPR